MPVAPLALDPRYGSGSTAGQFNPLPGFSLGGGVTDLVVQMAAQQAMQSRGMFPGGLSGQNLYDRMESFRLQQMHDGLMAEAARRDTETYFRSFRGLSSLAGIPFGMNQYAAANSMAGRLADMGPFAAQLLPPELLDSFGGSKGLSVVMADQIFKGGRFRLDPVSGRPTLSENSLQNLQTGVFDSVFGGDTFRRTGLSAGQTGQLFNELQQVGMMPGGRVSITDMLNSGDRRTMNRLFDLAVTNNVDLGAGAGVDPRLRGQQPRLNAATLTAQQLSALTSDPGVEAAMRSFDSNRVIASLENYSGVIKAMQEIFGAAGQPDAPIPMILNTLQQLTGGAVAQLNPATVERMARVTDNLARSSGMTLQGALMLSEAAQTQAQQMGLPDIFAANATQGSLAFRGAYQQLGLGAYPAYGATGIQSITMQDMQLRLAAAGSRLSNQLGAALRLEDAVGPGAFAAGSDAERLLSAAKAGATEYTDANGNRRSLVSLQDDEFRRILSEGSTFGLDDAGVDRILNQREANLEFVQSAGLDAVSRRSQAEEFFGLLSNRTAFTAQQRLASLGLNVDGRQLELLSQSLASAASEGLQELSPAQRASRSQRLTVLSRRLQQQLAAAAGGAVDGVDAATATQFSDRLENDPRFITALAEEIWGETEAFSRDPFNPLGSRSAQDALTLMDSGAARVAAQQQARAETRAMAQEALSPLGRTGFLRRGIQAVMDAGPDADLMEVLGKAAGGTPYAEIAGVLDRREAGGESAIEALQRVQREYEDAAAEFEQAADPVSATAARGVLQGKYEVYKNEVAKLERMIRRQGFYFGTGVESASLDTLSRTQELASAMLEDPRRTAGDTRAALTEEMRLTDDFLAAMHMDTGSLTRLGPEGIATLQQMQESRTELSRLAASYADGDFQKLLSGDPLPGVSAAESAALRRQAVAHREQLRAGGQFFQSRLLGSENDFAYLTPSQQQALKTIAETVSSKDGYSDIVGIESLLSPELREADINYWQESGYITADQAVSLRQARGNADEVRGQIAERQKKFNRSGQEILAEVYAKTRGLPVSDALSAAEAQSLLGQDHAAVLSAMDSASPVAKEAFGRVLRDEDALNKLARETGAVLDDGRVVGAGALEMFQRIQQVTSGLEEETASEKPLEVKIAVAQLVLSGEGGTITGSGVPINPGRP